MRYKLHFGCQTCILVILVAFQPNSVTAQENNSITGGRSSLRGTLLQWSYGTSFSGGPDLNAPLMTDRPDFTEASSTVGKGVLQIESGYTFTHDEDLQGVETRSHSHPETLFRYGVFADWLELRAAGNFPTERTGPSRSSGMEDLYLGVKIGLTPQEGILPEMALMPQLTVPTGASDFTTGRVLPGMNWLYGWDVTDSISTAGSTQFNQSIDGQTGDVYTEWAQSWTIGYSLAEKLGAYTEWFALFPTAAETEKPQYYFNGGFTYQFTNNIQWDIRSGVGLNEAAADFFAGTGLSLRFW